ncbi:MAG: hypothetical protein AB2990_04385 [Candidatus Symbiodolus clandestinus]
MSLRDTRGQDREVLAGQPQRVDHNHLTALPALCPHYRSSINKGRFAISSKTPKSKQ